MTYGFISVPGTREWSFTVLPQDITNHSGDWTDANPTYECQADRYETCGCTAYCVHNGIEFVAKKLYGVELNGSEYFNIILANVYPPGRPSRYAFDSVKKHGIIPADMLPLPETEEAYLHHRQTPSRYMLDEGLEWLSKWEFDYEELFAGDIPIDRQLAWIRYGLKRSPLAIGTHGHCTLITKENDGLLTIFDTYDHTSKERRIEDCEIVECVRFYLTPRVHKEGLLAKVMKLLRGIIQAYGRR